MIHLLLFVAHISIFLFFFNDTATTEIYTLSLHDALPICRRLAPPCCPRFCRCGPSRGYTAEATGFPARWLPGRTPRCSSASGPGSPSKPRWPCLGRLPRSEERRVGK